MREVDEALELMKQEYKRRMDACEERRLQFEAKQIKLREQVLKFEKFIQENDAKRMRAEAKAKHERKQYDLLCQEMNRLLLKIKDLEDNQAEFQSELRKLYTCLYFY
jgi:chromosome segregation ATPase